LGPRWNSPSFVSFSTQKNIINKKWLEKPNILWGILIWAYKLAKEILSHFDIGEVYMLHRGTCAISSNHDFIHRLSWFLWFICISVLYWSQNYSQACTCHEWRKHQVWDFVEMVCYFLRFNWISARRDRLIIGWTESIHEKIWNGAELLHRI
jgi:hypothetical protein